MSTASRSRETTDAERLVYSRFDHNARVPDFMLDRACTARKLVETGSKLDALLLVAVSLDAFASIWFHDDAEAVTDLSERLGKRDLRPEKIPGTLRFTEFLRRFAPNDPFRDRVAVPIFVLDWLRHEPENTTARMILEYRDHFGRFGHASDPCRHAFIDLFPEIGSRPGLRRLVEEYTYAAFAYRFVRNSLVHHGFLAKQTPGVADGHDVIYVDQLHGEIGISIGPSVYIDWLFQAASSYYGFSMDRPLWSAWRYDPGDRPRTVLDAEWRTALALRATS